MSISGGLELDTGLSSSFSLVKIDTFEFDDMKSQDIVGTRFTIGYPEIVLLEFFMSENAISAFLLACLL